MGGRLPPLCSNLNALKFKAQATRCTCGKYAENKYALEGNGDVHALTHTHARPESHMERSINELPVLMSAVEGTAAAIVEPLALIGSISGDKTAI